MRRALAGLLVVCAVLGGLATSAGAVVRKPHSGPIRVLLIGDSLTVSYQQRAAELLGAGYAVTGAGVGSSGLLDADVCKGRRAQALVAQSDPDVVVVEYTGNYAVRLPVCWPAMQPKQFLAKWKQSANQTRNQSRRKGARVLFMLVPSSTRAGYEASVPQLNTVYRGITGVTLVDAWTAFGGATYDSSLHTSDGLHLSPAGVERMAQTVVAKVTG